MADPKTPQEVAEAFPDRGSLSAIDPGKGATAAPVDARIWLPDIRADQTAAADFDTHTSIAWEPVVRPAVPAGSIGQGTGVNRDLQVVGGKPDDPTPRNCVADVPLSYPALVLGTVTSTTIPLTWAAVDDATKYTIRWKVAGTDTWLGMELVTALTYTISDLTAGTDYIIQANAVNDAGSGAWSPDFPATTVVPAPTDAPVVTLGTATTTSFPVQYTSVTGASGYDLQYRLETATDWTAKNDITASPYTLSGLTAASTYQVQVRAKNAGGAGPWSSLVEGTTAANPPSSAPTLSVSDITQSGATLTWSAVENATSYNLRYRETAETDWTEHDGVTALTYALTGLDASTSYLVGIQAVDSAGTGPWSSDVPFDTLPVAPTEAPTLTVSNISANNATMTWTGVDGATKYNLRYKLVSASDYTPYNGFTGLTTTLGNLVAASDYVAGIQAANAAGTGPWCDDVPFTTGAASEE